MKVQCHSFYKSEYLVIPAPMVEMIPLFRFFSPPDYLGIPFLLTHLECFTTCKHRPL